MRSENDPSYFLFTLSSMEFRNLFTQELSYGYRIANDHFQWFDDPWQDRPKSVYELLKRVAVDEDDVRVVDFLHGAIDSNKGVIADGEWFEPAVIQTLLSLRKDLVACDKCGTLYPHDPEYCVCRKCRQDSEEE